MFKQFATALVSYASLSMAKKLKCDKNVEEGSTCAEIYRETLAGEEIMIFPENSAMLKLSSREIEDTKKDGHKGDCHWQLKITDKATGDWKSLQEHGGSYEFDGFTVQQQGKCKYNTWLITAAKAATGVAPNATDLEFINSCDIRPESEDDKEEDEKDKVMVAGSDSDSEEDEEDESDSGSDSEEEDEISTSEQEDEMEYANPQLFNVTVQIISTEDQDGDSA